MRGAKIAPLHPVEGKWNGGMGHLNRAYRTPTAFEVKPRTEPAVKIGDEGNKHFPWPKRVSCYTVGAKRGPGPAQIESED